MKSGVKVVKREEREARDNLLVADDLVGPRITPESIVKSWIAASRERRLIQEATGLRKFRRWDAGGCSSLFDEHAPGPAASIARSRERSSKI